EVARDGRADSWAREHGRYPSDPSDRNEDRDGNGYTSLEEYRHERAAPGFPADYPRNPPEWDGEPFEPPVPPEPEHGPLPVLDGEIVRNAVVRYDTADEYANASTWSVQQDLQPGALVAVDRA